MPNPVVIPIKLHDQISGGITTIHHAFDALRTSNVALNGSINKLQGELSHLTSAVKGTNDTLGKLKNSTSHAGKEAEHSGTSFLKMATAVAAGGAVVEGLTKAFDLAREASIALWESFKDSYTVTESVRLAKGEAGVLMLEKMKKAAEATGVPFKDAETNAQKLLLLFGDTERAEHYNKLLMDLRGTTAGGAEGFEKLNEQFLKMSRMGGGISGKLLSGFAAKAGVDITAVQRKLAEMSHKPLGDIMTMWKKGKVSMVDYIKAIEGVELAMHNAGSVGEGALMDAARNPISGVQALVNKWEDFKEMFANAIFKNPAFMDMITKIGKSLQDLIENSNFQKFIEGLGDDINKFLSGNLNEMLKAFNEMSAADKKKAFEDLAQGIRDTLDVLGDLVWVLKQSLWAAKQLCPVLDAVFNKRNRAGQSMEDIMKEDEERDKRAQQAQFKHGPESKTTWSWNANLNPAATPPDETAANLNPAATPPDETAPAHALGGQVMRPAAGEMFASVAPGEFIVPAAAMPSSGGGGGSSTNTSTFNQTVNVTAGGGGGGSQQAPLKPEEITQIIRKATLDVIRSEQAMIIMQGGGQ